MTRPASVLRALRGGFRGVVAARAWVFLAYGWNLALAACLAAVLYESIRASLGSSLAGDRMRAGWDSLWYYGFSARASGVAATFKPSVVGVGAVLDGLDAFLDGFLSLFTGGVGSGVLPIAALYLLSWTFLGGGFLGTFLKTCAPEGFLARAGRHFPRLVAVSLAGLAAYFVILGPLRDRLDAVREGVVHDVIDERVRFAWTLAEYLLLWALVLAVNVVLDYAKVFVVRDGRSPLRSAARSLRFVLAHPAKVVRALPGDRAPLGRPASAVRAGGPGCEPVVRCGHRRGVPGGAGVSPRAHRPALPLLRERGGAPRRHRGLSGRSGGGMTRSAAAVLGAIAACTVPAAAQQGAADIGSRLLADPSVRAALDLARSGEPRVLEEQVRLCEIPAPTFQEGRRAAVLEATFRELGLRNVRIDAVGNVLGERPGRSPRPHVVVAAHLDTVFPEGTDLTVKREGAVYMGPGIGDNCRGLAAMVGLIRALQGARVETPGSITFVANVCEEGLGNLKGAFHLFEAELKGRIDRFVSIDGSGIGFVNVGVGSERYRVTFKGPGGHSYFAFGRTSPIHALGRAVSRIAEIRVPKDPRTTYNVGRIGGGTSVNSIAFEAWMEIDMRSHDAAALKSIDDAIHRAVEEAVALENASTDGKGTVTAEWEKIGTRVPGKTPDDSAIVEGTRSVTRALGLPVQPFPATTDSNVAMMYGVPAVTLDGGGAGSGGHSLGEFFDSTDSWKGTQRALLLAIALTHP